MTSHGLTSEIDVNNETIALVVNRLTAELHDFAAFRGISDAAVEANLGAVHRILLGNLHDLIKVGPVVAIGASGLGVRVVLDPAVYRRVAEAAKDCMLGGISSA